MGDWRSLWYNVHMVKDVRFSGNVLSILLSDERTISLLLRKIEWLKWLANADESQRQNWSLEPGGYAIYWNALDNGIEIEHLLSMSPLI